MAAASIAIFARIRFEDSKTRRIFCTSVHTLGIYVQWYLGDILIAVVKVLGDA